MLGEVVQSNKAQQRYKVMVLLSRKRRGVAESDIAIDDGDTFFGFSKSIHELDKHFDLWLSKDGKMNDPKNFVGFGRITRIKATFGGRVFTTYRGTFIMQELSDATALM